MGLELSGYQFDKPGSLLADPRHLYLRDGIVTSNISSTLVRNRGRGYEEEKVRALVPDKVWDYLVEHRLLGQAETLDGESEHAETRDCQP